ncbi:MAG: four-carbon acid sugar kinase family protein [Gaiellales bacterium]
MTGLRLVADDLTGAADAAVAFVGRCDPVRVLLGPCDVPAARGVTAVDLDTRDRPALDPGAAFRAAIGDVGGDGAVMVKIDSLLRGPVAETVAAARAAFPDRPLVVAPAFPAVGRITVAGVQHRLEAPPPREVAGVSLGDMLANPGPALLSSADVANGALGHVLVPGAVVVCDATNDDDLDAIVAGAAETNPVWVGSGGLSRALARRTPAQRRPELSAVGPFLAVIGSRSEAARSQAIELARFGAHVELGTAPVLTPGSDGDNLVVTIATAQGRRSNSEVLAHLAEACAGAARGSRLLLLSGGATARAVLDGLDVRALQLEGELEPGVVVARAAELPGLIVLKAGSFGDAGTFVRAVRRLGAPA